MAPSPPPESLEVTPADIPGGFAENDLVRRARALLRDVRDSAAYGWLTETRPGMFVLGAAAGLLFATILFGLFSGGDPAPAVVPSCPAESEESETTSGSTSSATSPAAPEEALASMAPAHEASEEPPAEEVKEPAMKPAEPPAPPPVDKPVISDKPVFTEQPLVPPVEETKPAPPKRRPRRKVSRAAARRRKLARKKKLARKYLLAAKKAYRDHRYRSARRLASKALRYQPGNRQAARLRARARNRLRR